MNTKHKIILWSFIILLSIGIITLSTTFILNAIFSTSPLDSKNERSVVTPVSTNGEDFDKETVNTPLEHFTVTLSDGTNGHDFISDWHDFYNDTVGWGRLETTSYEAQKEAALKIIESLNNVEVSNNQIAEDLQHIVANAQKVLQQDDRTAMRNLHRYFHDLDIYFNGYNYNQTFGITDFRGL